MSVINQMLRDLDSRQASEMERAGLPPRLRSLPGAALAKNAGRGWRMLALGIAFGVLLAGLVFWLLAPLVMPLVLRGAPPTTLPVATPQPPVAPPAALPAEPPVSTEVVGIVAEPTAAMQAAEETLRPPLDQADMKLSILLSQDKLSASSPPVAEEIPVPKESTVDNKTPVETPAEIKPAPKAETKPAEARPPLPIPTMMSAPSPKPVAGTQIDKRAKSDPVQEMAETEYRKGVQAVKRGETSPALSALQRAIELDPGFAKARQALLSVLVGARQWTEAQQVAQNGLALDPAQSGWAMIVARLQFEQNNTTAAIETLERYAVHAANDADYHGFFAYLLQKQQRSSEAAQHFQLAVGLRPGEGRWWFGLGLARESAGHTKEAQDAYAKAREVGNLPTDMAAVVAQKLK